VYFDDVSLDDLAGQPAAPTMAPGTHVATPPAARGAWTHEGVAAVPCVAERLVGPVSDAAHATAAQATPQETFPAPPASGGARPGGRPAQAEFERFFEAHHRELARFAFLLSGDRDAAEDITAEALTSAWVHWDRVQAADNPLAYVRRSVANLAAGRIRRTVRERNVLAKLGRQLPIQTTNGPDLPAVLDLESALLHLPLRKRQCVILRHGLDLSEAETAETLGISIGTVKSQTSKAVGELERLLAGAAAPSGAGAPARKRPSIRVALRGGQA
jgi:RNA polymerase sigma-70 factor (sigma-E family)